MPIKFSDSESPEVHPAPELGEHTEEVLSELGEFSDEEIESIRTND
jgi:crotonobetainyl-CoA:carnitine CoA-transferase CaiB-like acyl-CoA transferase